jgi:two-component system, NtrC family, response regulator AtoC
VKVLIADDDSNTRFLLELYCRKEELTPILVDSGREALRRFAEGDVDLVVTDVYMPDVSGEAVLEEVKKRSPETPVLIMTAHATVDDAVRFLKRGADDYITKPVTQEVFGHRLKNLLERVSLSREVRELRANKLQSGETLIVGETPAMQQMLDRLPMTAQTDATVLVYGESGTGKELVAARIHELSKRRGKKFVTVNCGALSDQLLESELFGYKRGAFTDAHRDTAGLVEEADGGTLFLDEIGEVSPAVQVKLLRFLQSKEYKALGSPKTSRADVRIVAATNRDLKQAVQEGSFREDLYYRLAIVPITVPPLRDRKADIPLLAQFFLNSFRRQYGKEVRGFAPEAMRDLQAYDWPGNVRELENKVQQLVVLATEPLVRRIDVPEDGGRFGTFVGEAPFKDEKKRVIDAFEREYVRRVLERAKGNLSEAARLAELDRKNFWLLAKRHGLKAGGPRPHHPEAAE